MAVQGSSQPEVLLPESKVERGGDAKCPRAPSDPEGYSSDLAGSKRHLTFPALKEYDSREADGENRESSKRGE